MPPPAHLKGALVDKYAEIALFDAAENQRVILESQAAAAKKKGERRATTPARLRVRWCALVCVLTCQRHFLFTRQPR